MSEWRPAWWPEQEADELRVCIPQWIREDAGRFNPTAEFDEILGDLVYTILALKHRPKYRSGKVRSEQSLGREGKLGIGRPPQTSTGIARVLWGAVYHVLREAGCRVSVKPPDENSTTVKIIDRCMCWIGLHRKAIERALAHAHPDNEYTYLWRD